MGLVSIYDITDEDHVLVIDIHDEPHAVAIDWDTVQEIIDPPEQCDGCGSTVTEEESLRHLLSAPGAGEAWPLRREDERHYACTRPGCGHTYVIHRHKASDTVF